MIAPSAPSPDLWLFFALVFGIIALPGMDMAYVGTNALVGGLRSGLLAVAGIVAGGVVHVAVAFTGLAVLLALWPAAFDALLVAGAAYMTWVGWTLWRAARPSSPGSGPGARHDAHPPAPPTPARVFARAMLTCLLNPKAYAFTLAVFPAYMHAGTRAPLAQALTLSAIIAATQVTVYGTVAVVSAGTRRLAGAGGASANTTAWMLRVTGPLLMAGAVATVVLGWKPAHAASAQPIPSTTTPAAPGAAMTDTAPLDGRHDFDFLHGHWRLANRKRVHLLDMASPWETFEAESTVRPLPGGIGNLDDFTSPTWRPGFVGMTLRIYSPQSRRWSLFWMSNRDGGLDPATGLLQAPVVGAFHGDTGTFECDDVIDGIALRVRYTWQRIDADHAHWEQAFSRDGGRSWDTNWMNDLTRM